MKSKDRWISSNTCITNLEYHIIWCPKYRKKILTNGIDETLKVLLKEKANELNCVIHTMEVMPDHVHLFVKTPATIGVHFLIQQLKGYTSRKLREMYPEIKRKLPCMWTRSYYAESVGHISEESIKKYIEEQKNK